MRPNHCTLPLQLPLVVVPHIPAAALRQPPVMRSPPSSGRGPKITTKFCSKLCRMITTCSSAVRRLQLRPREARRPCLQVSAVAKPCPLCAPAPLCAREPSSPPAARAPHSGWFLKYDPATKPHAPNVPKVLRVAACRLPAAAACRPRPPMQTRHHSAHSSVRDYTVVRRAPCKQDGAMQRAVSRPTRNPRGQVVLRHRKATADLRPDRWWQRLPGQTRPDAILRRGL